MQPITEVNFPSVSSGAPFCSRPFSLRPITPEDRPLLELLYASARAEELAAVPWSAPQRAAFLKMQFDLQHQYYQSHFPSASYDVVQVDGHDVGRRYVNRAADALALMEMTLLPDWRGRGLGSAILHGLLSEARDLALPVRLHVEPNNRAVHLYARLGFVEVANNGVYSKQEWQPSAMKNESPLIEIA